MAKASPVAPASGGSTAVGKPASTAFALPVAMAGEVLSDAQENAPKFTKDDLAIPFLRILQAKSPQVEEGSPNMIEGAKASMFFNTVTAELYEGQKEGIIVLPVAYQSTLIEWKPRSAGGGFVRDHGSDAALQKTTHKGKRDDGSASNRDILPNGNELTLTAMYYVLIVNPATGDSELGVLSMVSTQLKKSRKWNTAITGIVVVHPDTQQKFRPAPYFMSWRVRSVYEKNDQGSWYGYAIEQHVPVFEFPQGEQLFFKAKELKALIGTGAVKVDIAQEAEATVETEFEVEEEGGGMRPAGAGPADKGAGF